MLRADIAAACIVPRGAAQLGELEPAGDDTPVPVPAKGKTDAAMVLRELRSSLDAHIEDGLVRLIRAATGAISVPLGKPDR